MVSFCARITAQSPTASEIISFSCEERLLIIESGAQ